MLKWLWESGIYLLFHSFVIIKLIGLMSSLFFPFSDIKALSSVNKGINMTAFLLSNKKVFLCQ